MRFLSVPQEVKGFRQSRRPVLGAATDLSGFCGGYRDVADGLSYLMNGPSLAETEEVMEKL
jgi:hypothetical protein